MKTNLSRTAAFTAALIASLFATSTYAGPGAQYWANKNTSSAEVTKAAAANTACPGSQEVAVTTMKPSWPNGRGPLTEVQIGTERVCHMCPVTSVATTSAWANGRGPLAKTETTAVGATHRCGSNCNGKAVALN